MGKLEMIIKIRNINNVQYNPKVYIGPIFGICFYMNDIIKERDKINYIFLKIN